ncbi:oxygen-independent coproporphyrinogen III oxidase [Ferruginibacter lapsinanis]|uniref:oxygen-independent coproporphyrinogen III oxidase n=1 Tax=Ferruginibacter lapsinanis TaxID=563172 RepID=UPI001E370059|nr:oxygen-independent coproporphyrinogen III oxidase [Ferruginibacter lapsinanis]UEG51276.1 oxygen-independent coproporphyrinogen III oxidase [Ferruginibacter lapsinanis]
MTKGIDNLLVKKYNLPIPRYTSYPTVPVWKEGIDKEQWKQVFNNQFSLKNQQQGISLYLHLPFCESLCTYCGCNKKITTNHSVEEEYIAVILREWKMYRELMSEKPIIREIHLGGGTPTFFSPKNLAYLLNTIYADSIIHAEHEFSIEGHPNNTTVEHLQTLYDLGFRRISYGVQDNDPEVQRIINRIQPVENVQRATDNARKIGFRSVNFDLIYGLPLQNMERMKKTIEQCIAMRPDRIAFYSYAHVPWTSRGQRLFDENDLPTTQQKMELYQLGKQLFSENGYHDIGMDHFALASDDLYKAWQEGWLHRNFMGYTTQRTAMLLGLGVSSISDAGVAFAQNEKTIHDYYAAVNNNEPAVFRGYFLNKEDIAFRKYILDISCQNKTVFQEENLATLKECSFPVLEKLAADGLIEWDETCLQVTPLGRNFIRNICSAFDLYLIRDQSNSNKPTFSKAI